MKKKFCFFVALAILASFNTPSSMVAKAADGEYYGMSIDENNNIDYITYDEYHAYDNLSLNNEMYLPENVIISQINNNLLPAAIIGDDNRTQISDSQYQMFPYSAICMVKGYFDTDGDGIADTLYAGTGAIVGPKTVLSSPRLIYRSEYGWAIKTEVLPATYKTSEDITVNPYGIIEDFTKLTVGMYHNTGDPNDAWAILDLATDIGSQTGYFGTNSTDITLNSEIKLIGYCGDFNMNIAHTQGIVTHLETYKFYHNCDTGSGSMGSPLLFGMNMVGIHLGSIDTNNNSACKISSYIVGWINERLQ